MPEIICLLATVAAICLFFMIVGIIADYVLPRIGPLARFVEELAASKET